LRFYARKQILTCNMGEIRHLLATDDLTTNFVERHMNRTDELRSTEGKELRASQEELSKRKVGGLTIYVAMFEPSLRTADSHTLSAFWLGMHVRNRDTPEQSSSRPKGESKRDMVMNIAAQGFDAVVIRDKGTDTSHMLAAMDVVPIINAGNGPDDHPTQGLADIYTVNKEVGDHKGLTIGIVGDNYHGRVNRADIRMFSKFSNRLVLASIPGMEIQDDIRRQLMDQGTEFHEVDTLVNAMEFEPDAVVLSRFQRERYTGDNPRTGEPWDTAKIEREYHERMALTPKILRSKPRKTKILHPLPKGLELPDDTDESVVIWRQVKNSVWSKVTTYEHIFGVGPFEDE
jgi:aspartate carbamoyltransferase catalytic subunit